MSENFELVEAEGQAWQVSHVGKRHRDQFSAWAKMRAQHELNQLRQAGAFDGAEYREQVSILHEALTAGAYSWKSPEPRRWGTAIGTLLTGLDGKLYLLGLLLCDQHGPLAEERIESLFDSAAEAFMLALYRAMGLVPNSPPPEPGSEPPAAE